MVVVAVVVAAAVVVWCWLLEGLKKTRKTSLQKEIRTW
jgi:hypothetical protein